MKLTLTERIIFWFMSLFFKHRDIFQDDGSLYLRRYFIWTYKDGRRLFLHRIRFSDNDRAMHDHPWDFKTTLLTGSYIEHTFFGPKFWPWLSEIDHAAEFVHRLELKEPLWTIVEAKPARRVWGFWLKHPDLNGYYWLDWRTFLGLPKETPDSPEDAIGNVRASS